MKLSSILGLSALLGVASAGDAATVSYDTGYDIGSRSLNDVACSDGANGLITRYGWKTQGQVKRFPYIGGAQAVGSWNSNQCGTCWKLYYQGKTVYVLAVDHADSGFNIALDAMNALTNGQASQLGRITASTKKVAVSYCGL